MKKSYEMDMCSGPLFQKLLVFALPLSIVAMAVALLYFRHREATSDGSPEIS